MPDCVIEISLQVPSAVGFELLDQDFSRQFGAIRRLIILQKFPRSKAVEVLDCSASYPGKQSLFQDRQGPILVAIFGAVELSVKPVEADLPGAIAARNAAATPFVSVKRPETQRSMT